MAEITVTQPSDSDPRHLRALTIAATMPVKRDDRGWIVPSQVGHGEYRVAPTPLIETIPGTGGLGCECPDYLLRGRPCKHVLAVEIVIKRETTTVDGSVVSQQLRLTYSQNWPAYNAAQCAEGDLFLPMLADLCSTIPNPPQGRGRPRLPMSDMAFTAISKVYSGLSARRFDSQVRDAKAEGLTADDPCFSSVLGYLRKPELTPVLKSLVTASALPLRGIEENFAVDSTGFSTCTYARWFDHKWGKEQSVRQWVKLHAMTGTLTNAVTEANVTSLRGADSPQFIPLVKATAENFTLNEVSGDKAYSSKKNLQAVADLGAIPFIPFKNAPVIEDIAKAPQLPLNYGTAWVKMYHQFSYQRDTFLAHYHRRSNVETTFSMIKRKHGEAFGPSPSRVR
jgi:hypothetical protein